jgi:hypothetical protein
MRNHFTALVLFCLLVAFTSCEMLETIVPKPDRQDTADTIDLGWCRTYWEESADTITKGIYLGFTIGQKASSSCLVMQDLALRKKIYSASPVTREVANDSQLEKSVPLYNMLFLRHGETISPEVSISLEGGKVKTITLYPNEETSSLAQWPASEPASAAVKEGDLAEMAAKTLLSLKEDPQYASYFNFVLLSQKDLTRGYDPVMGSMPEWNFRMPAGARKEDNVYLQFKQGVLSAIVVRHLVY